MRQLTCDDMDPPWINKDIKKLIHEKNHACKSYRRNKVNVFSLHQFELLQSKSNSLIEKSKFNYYTCLSKKLLDRMTSLKTYWSILKTFLNNKKIPCIPLLLHDDKFIPNLKKRVKYWATSLQNNVLL